MWPNLSYKFFFNNQHLKKSGYPPWRIGNIWVPPNDEWRNMSVLPQNPSPTPPVMFSERSLTIVYTILK